MVISYRHDTEEIHENRHLFFLLGKSIPQLRKAMLKYGIDNEFINLLSEFYLHLTKGNVQLPEVGKQ